MIGFRLIFALAAVILFNCGCGDEEILSEEKDTQPPVVELTAPTDGRSFFAGADIEITAVANDNRTVTYVEFYLAGNLLAADSASPYQVYWYTTKITPTGPYSIFARAYDRALNSAASDTVTIYVN